MNLLEHLPRGLIWGLYKLGGVINDSVEFIAEHVCGL